MFSISDIGPKLPPTLPEHASTIQPSVDTPPLDQDAQRPRVVEIPDDEGYWVEEFLPGKEAGATFGASKMTFTAIQDEQVLRGGEVWGPFRDEDEWQLAKWLIKNVGHNQTEEFLKLSAVCT